MKYAQIISEPVPQSQPLDDHQKKNSAGGFVYELDDWKRLRRFLILGSDAATYYQSAKDLTKKNVTVVERCWNTDAVRTAAMISEISLGGKAPKNDPAIFALAVGAANKDLAVRREAYARLDEVCRTATHLFAFLKASDALGRGWGRAFKRAVGKRYVEGSVDKLAYQTVKYRSREGYTHRDVLRLVKPAVSKDDTKRRALFSWIVGKGDGSLLDTPAIVRAHIDAMRMESDVPAIVKLVKEYNLPWEALPTGVTKDARVWAAMLPNMGLTALIRNLASMTSYGVFKPLSAELGVVLKRLSDAEEVKRSRIHPFAALQAMKVYASGHGFRGGLTWVPVPQIVAALDKIFYMAFGNVESTGKRTLVALDVSGSMGSAMGDSALTVREASSAMAMVAMRTEPVHHVIGFTGGGLSGGRFGGYGNGVSPLPIHADMTLKQICDYTNGLPFGGTDCALPMLYAAEKGLDVDAIIIYSDNETWAGNIHPMQALKDYRRKTGIPTKLIVCGMTSTGFSVADPEDGGALDLVGFDTSAPAVMADFIAS